MGAIFIDNMDKFERKFDDKLDKVAQHMAMDIEILAKVKNAPQKTSRLLNTIVHFKVKKFHWRIPANTDYAAYQEMGQRRDGSHKVVNYSKPGTGAHYLRNSGDAVKKNALKYFKQRLGDIKL